MTDTELIEHGLTIPILRGFPEISILFDIASAHRAVIAGGYARFAASSAEKPVLASDVDFFFEDEAGYDGALAALLEIGYVIRRSNPMCATLDTASPILFPSVQLIRPSVLKGNATEIIQHFDFSVSRVAIISPTEAIADEDFLKDEKSKRLRIKYVACPVSGILRCTKYVRKGYFLPPSEALKLLIDWESRDENYRSRIGELMNNPDITQEDIDELEAMLRID